LQEHIAAEKSGLVSRKAFVSLFHVAIICGLSMHIGLRVSPMRGVLMQFQQAV
jgi:hypothetical protein